MSRSARLQPLVEIAQSKERDCAKQLSALLQQKAEQEANHAQLVAYLQEYERGQAQHETAGTSITQLRNHRAFVGQLNQAIQQQRARLRRIEDEISGHTERWREACAHVKSLDKVIERIRQDENGILERRAQKETDEGAQRLVQKAGPGLAQ